MRSFLYILSVFIFAQCKQEGKYVSMPGEGPASGPSTLIEQHHYLLAKVKSLSEENDSTAAKLYEVMNYHFSEEEKYVFPPLSVLPELASGKVPTNSDEIIALTVQFKSNSAKLLAEHQMIKALLVEFKQRSKVNNDAGFAEFEKELAEHAKAEEEIFFPAAIVVGDYLKLKPNTSRP